MWEVANKFKNALVVIASLALVACGGREPRPVMVSQFGDNEKSCDVLRFEIKQTELEIQRLLPKKDKTTKNIALGAAGILVPVAWLFLDLTKAEEVEYEALRQRHSHLVSIAISKKCSVNADKYLSLEELKKHKENVKK